MSSLPKRMEAVPEEDFANLENITTTSTVEVIKTEMRETPLVSYPTIPEKFDMIASVAERPQFFNDNFQSQFPKINMCCFAFDLRCGLNIWLLIETFIWFALFVSAFYYEIVFIHTDDYFDFFDLLEYSWYPILIFGGEHWEVDSQIRSKLKFQFLIEYRFS